MKRKFISVAVMGLMLLAPAFTMVSCSDNDDDIKQLNEDVSSLQTKLDQQTTALNEAKQALESEITTANAAITAAQTAATEAKKAAAEAQSTGDAAAQAAAEAAESAAAAQASANAAAAAAAQAKLDAVAEAQALVDALEKKVASAESVNELSDELTKLASKVAAIEEDLNKLGDRVDANEQAIEELQIQMKAVKAYEERIKTLETTVTDLSDLLSEYVTAQQVQMQINAVYDYIDELLEDYAKKADVPESVDLTEVNSQLRKLAEQVSAIEDELVTLQGDELRSLVFQPDFYYQGIEAMSASTFVYNAYTVKKVDANGDYKTDAPVASKAQSEMTPGLTANYHINPTSAKMDEEDMSKYNFVVLNRDYVRADAKTITPTIYSADVNDGMLTVKAKFTNAQYVKDIEGDQQVTVIALQYKLRPDTVVTSDYAAIKAYKYNDFILNNAMLQGRTASHDYHLYTTAQEAIENDNKMVEIEWNGTLDLDSVVNTHRSVVNGTNAQQDVKWDDMAADQMVKANGFKYSYQLVGYHSGSNKTSETAHLALAADGHTVRAQLPKADGTQAEYGAEQGRAEIDRKPLVRVLLTDTVSNKVVAVGYIKLNIVEYAVDPTPDTETFDFAFNDPYTLVCDDNNAFTGKLEWYQVELEIINELGLTKAEFEDNYKLVQNASGTAQIFEKDENGELVASDFGVVKEIVNADDHQTTVIQWTVSNNTAYQHFKGGIDTDKTIYIKYQHQTKPNSYVYVKLTWAPSDIKMDPTATLNNTDKIAEYWYSQNSAVAGSGYDDIHGNVEVVGQTNNEASVTPASDDEFVFDVKSAFTETFKANNFANAFTSLKKDYPSLYAAKKVTFHFVKPEISTAKGVTGSWYKLSVSADGTQFLATQYGAPSDSVIAIATITSDGIVTYEKNAWALDLLNYADHSELGERQTLTGRIAITLETCDPAGEVEVSNNAFNVKFLRPVTASKGTASFVDAETGGSEAKVSMTFTDWRDHNFNNYSQTKGYNYYKYYGISAIDADLYNIKTNMNGGNIDETLLRNVSKDVKFSYKAPTGDLATALNSGDFGTIRYENNGLTVGEFQVRIPVTITYDWGKITTYIDATVKKTQANAQRRH